jgi:hypothetical protein
MAALQVKQELGTPALPFVLEADGPFWVIARAFAAAALLELGAIDLEEGVEDEDEASVESGPGMDMEGIARATAKIEVEGAQSVVVYLVDWFAENTASRSCRSRPAVAACSAKGPDTPASNEVYSVLEGTSDGDCLAAALNSPDLECLVTAAECAIALLKMQPAPSWRLLIAGSPAVLAMEKIDYSLQLVRSAVSDEAKAPASVKTEQAYELRETFEIPRKPV